MRDLRLLFCCIWRTYAQDCIALAKVIAIRESSDNKLVIFIRCIRLRIAIGLLHEAEMAYNYADRLIEDH